MNKTKDVRYIRVTHCQHCPYRKMDKEVMDGTMDVCRMKNRGLDYRACSKVGEFPKGCPLPVLEKK